MDTIFALATAPGKAGVAVIRVSGPGAFSACEKLSGWLPESRAFRLVTIRDEDGTVIDRGLALAEQPLNFPCKRLKFPWRAISRRGNWSWRH